MNKPNTCDIFCNVIDNYGDIGVCWRLARQLAHEHGIAVRLWVDDLASLCRLCPEADASLAQQVCRGVEIRWWTTVAFCSFPQSLSPSPSPASGRGWPSGRERGVADLVIEAFACELPESYVAAMAAQEHKPVWINLEYLSAEDWVEGCHKLPSPHPSLPLVKYFFFPGFTPKTGGLLLERDLIARHDAFRQNSIGLKRYWKSLGLPAAEPDELRVSLFCYENPALPGLLADWAAGEIPVLCLVPEGRALSQLAGFFGTARAGPAGLAPAAPGDVFVRGNLDVRVLPFVAQERYDELLWACDVNFVRGEDSFVRAQWAGQPFVWHIYPQHDGVHLQKLRAFMQLYCAGLPPDAARALHGLWEGWNGGQGLSPASPFDTSGGSGHAWNDFWAHRSTLRRHAHVWAQELSHNSLALNLLDFFREVDRMCGFKI